MVDMIGKKRNFGKIKSIITRYYYTTIQYYTSVAVNTNLHLYINEIIIQVDSYSIASSTIRLLTPKKFN